MKNSKPKMCYVYDINVNIIEHISTDEIAEKYKINKVYLKSLIYLGLKYKGSYYFSREKIEDKLYFIRKQLEFNNKRNKVNFEKGVVKIPRTEFKGGRNSKIKGSPCIDLIYYLNKTDFNI